MQQCILLFKFAAAHPPVQVHAAAHPPVQVHAAALHPPPVQVRPPPANRTVDDLLDEARAKAPAAAPDAPPPIMAAESHEAGGPDSHGARGPDSHGPAERPMCCICQDMVSADPGENTCSPCGHVFHCGVHVRRLREVAEATKVVFYQRPIARIGAMSRIMRHLRFRIRLKFGMKFPFRIRANPNDEELISQQLWRGSVLTGGCSFANLLHPEAAKIVNLHFPLIYIFARIYIPNLRKLKGKCKFYIFPKNVFFRRKIEDFCKNENFHFFFAH